MREFADVNFYTSVPNLFPNCAKFAEALGPIADSKGINVHYKHLIKSVDGQKRLVTFEDLDTGKMVQS